MIKTKQRLQQHADEHGYKLNEDKHITDTTIAEIATNGGYCPCRSQRVNANICPCIHHHKEIKTDEHCYCMLFVKGE